MIDQVSSPHNYPFSRDINPAHKDPMDQGVNSNKLGTQPTCVINTIMEEVRSLIC